MVASPQQLCGFFGLGSTISEASLRAAVRSVAEAERQNWSDADGHAEAETVDGQFGHLVRYWLASRARILPSTLTFAQARAVDRFFIWGPLLDSIACDAEIASVRDAFLLGAPGVGKPPNLNALVKDALHGANRSGQGEEDHPWSAVFVVSCIRSAAILRGLEGESGGLHVGRDELLLAHEGHRFYVAKAYERRFGQDLKAGSYHTFRPNELPVQVGDIVVQDREADTCAEVVNFDDIPTKFKGSYQLHGDIVVEVAASNIETIGGNLISGDSSTPAVFSVRRRRFPIDDDGKLVVLRERLYTQEDNNGNLPALPPGDSPDDLNDRSTGRIFTLLKPVALCV